MGTQRCPGFSKFLTPFTPTWTWKLNFFKVYSLTLESRIHELRTFLRVSIILQSKFEANRSGGSWFMIGQTNRDYNLYIDTYIFFKGGVSLANLNTFGNPVLILEKIWMKFLSKIKNYGKKYFSPFFFWFLKLFRRDIIFKYQVGVQHLPVSQSNIRTKFKVFQIIFPVHSSGLNWIVLMYRLSWLKETCSFHKPFSLLFFFRG